jgi:hypothetical protein
VNTANPHATRLTLLLADVIVLAIVVTVLPMLWVGDAAIKLFERCRRGPR